MVYIQEELIPMEYIIPSLCIVAVTCVDGEVSLQECVVQLIQLEEYHFIIGFHQHVEKDRQKYWHDHHIKNKQFQQGDLVLLYDVKFMKHPCKLHMHWLGPFIVNSITSGGAIQLQQLDGEMLQTLVNGSWLKPSLTMFV